MNKSFIETFTGAFVIIVALSAAFIFVNKVTNIGKSKNQYIVKAKFENIEGVEQGSDIKIGGVKVGVVLEKNLDPVTYSAVLSLAIDDKIKLPDDSTAKISSSGLLGEKFLSITPGGDDKMIPANGEIKYTQSAVNLEQLIGKMIFSKEQTSK